MSQRTGGEFVSQHYLAVKETFWEFVSQHNLVVPKTECWEFAITFETKWSRCNRWLDNSNTNLSVLESKILNQSFGKWFLTTEANVIENLAYTAMASGTKSGHYVAAHKNMIFMGTWDNIILPAAFLNYNKIRVLRFIFFTPQFFYSPPPPKGGYFEPFNVIIQWI